MTFRHIILLVALAFTLLACQKQTQKLMSNYDYDAAWKAVDKALQEGLPKTALSQAKEILDTAKIDDLAPHIVRAVSVIAQTTTQVEEDGHLVALDLIEQEIAEAKAPANELLHALAAQCYQNYYDQNRYKIQQRTQTSGEAPADIRDWSTRHFYQKIHDHYQAALANPEHLNVDIEPYKELLTPYDKSGKTLRPTLYSLVAHQAMNYYGRRGAMLTQTASPYLLNDPRLLDETRVFTQMDLGGDALETKLQQILVYQNLEKNLATHGHNAALPYAQLQRIKYIYQVGDMPNNEERYLEALQRIVALKDTHASSEALYLLAQEKRDKEPAEAHKLANQVVDAYPNSKMANQANNLIAQIEQADLDIQTEITALPNEANTALISYRNLDKAYFRIASVDPADLNDISRRRNQDEVKSFLRKLKPIEEWTVNLPSTEAYSRSDVEITLPALSMGTYVIMASNDNFGSKDALFYTTIQSTQLAIISLDAQNRNEAYVVDRKTGKPMSGVQVSIRETYYDQRRRRQDSREVAQHTTDAQGMVKVDYIDRGLVLVATKGKDRYTTEHQIYFNQGYREPNSAFTDVFTDRAIYRPGQIVHYKGLVLTKQGKEVQSVTNAAMTITLSDANGQKVMSQKVQSNRFGSYAGKMALPEGGLTGNYYIHVEGEGLSYPGSSSIKVEEYKRPKFEVEIDPQSDKKKLGDLIAVNGMAKAFSGANISDAQVRYTVMRKAQVFWWYRYEMNGSGDNQMIANGFTKTDADGRFSFDFETIVPNANDRKHYVYTIDVDVTDVNGETRSTSKQYTLGQKPAILNIQLDNQVESQDLKELVVKATNFDGQNVDLSGEVTIDLLKAPANYSKKRFWPQPKNTQIKNYDKIGLPAPAYNRYEDWPVDRQVYQGKFQSGQTVNLPDMQAGVYRIVAQAPESDELRRYTVVVDFAKRSFPEVKGLYHKTNKDSYTPGDVAVATLGSAKALHILYAVQRSQKVDRPEWTQLSPSTKDIRIAINEEDRGGLWLLIAYVYDNRREVITQFINVPWTNKELDVKLLTERREALPGSKEEWSLEVTDSQGQAVQAELLAGMYDASLDQFTPFTWEKSYFNQTPNRTRLDVYGMGSKGLHNLGYQWNSIQWEDIRNAELPSFQWPNAYYDSYYGAQRRKSSKSFDGVMMSAPMSAEPEMAMDEVQVVSNGVNVDRAESTEAGGDDESKVSPVKEDGSNPVRSNFNETVFFFPQMSTDAQGRAPLHFTHGEALTTWKLQVMAHTPDMQYGYNAYEITTKKDLMITANNPRFLRAGDRISLPAKINNLSEAVLNGQAQITLYDALTGEDLSSLLLRGDAQQAFSLAKGAATNLYWQLDLPKDFVRPLRMRVQAKTDRHTDGEEHTLVVVTNRKLVTETMPMAVRGKQNKTFTFEHLLRNESSTLSHEAFEVEFTSNPMWYAVQALPYLTEISHENTDYIVNRYFSYAVGTTLVEANPRIKAFFNEWKRDGEALDSPLEKNEHLKSALLTETPWLRDAQSEAEQRRMIANFFDTNTMSSDMDATLRKLQGMQLSNGGFAWYAGGRDNIYTTQYVLEMLGRMKTTGLLDRHRSEIEAMATKALAYADDRMVDKYRDLIASKAKMSDNHLDRSAIQYLYIQRLFDRKNQGSAADAYKYYAGQAAEYWLKQNTYLQALVGEFLLWKGDDATVAKIKASLLERAMRSDELGMYWKGDGCFWHQLPIDRQAQMISFFGQLGEQDVVDELCIWLLKNKETNRWESNKATSAAVYALLTANGQGKLNPWIDEQQPVRVVIGGKPMAAGPSEAGTLYRSQAYSADAVDTKLGTIKVDNPNEQVAWGAAYWQYFEDLDAIEGHDDTPLKLRKALYRKVTGERGDELVEVKDGGVLAVGEQLVSRIFVEVDRDMEFVHLKDMRAAGVEPVDVLSVYRYQGGLGFYMSTMDLATNFFMDYLPKGSYVLEYDVWVSHPGDFSVGIATIQSMYAPAYSSHSDGASIEVK